VHVPRLKASDSNTVYYNISQETDVLNALFSFIMWQATRIHA